MMEKSNPKTVIFSVFFILVLSVNFNHIFFFASTETTIFESDAPKGIRLTLPDDPRSSIAISWYTYKNTETTMKFGLTPVNLDQSNPFSADTDHVEDTYIHHITLKNLSTNTTYYYSVGGAIGGWSNVYSFTTAPERNATSLHFVAYGDNRSDRVLRRLVNRAILQNGTSYSSEPVKFIMHMGDMVSRGDEHDLFNGYFEDSQMLHESIPLLPTQGNHEFGNLGQSYYRDQFVLPENGNAEWYWALQSGSAFIMGLDSEAHGMVPYDTQSLPWIESMLQKSHEETSVLWRFALFHQPPFVSSSHAPRTDIQNTWSPVFDANDVDLVFNGHCHLYERSYPVSANETLLTEERYNYNDPDYPIYVVTGAAGRGGPIDRLPERDNAYMVMSNFTWHYMDISITNNYVVQQSTLTANVVGILPQYHTNGTINEFDLSQTVLLDNFTITKDIPEGWQDSVQNIIYEVMGDISQQKILGLGLSGLVVLILFGVSWRILRKRARYLQSKNLK